MDLAAAAGGALDDEGADGAVVVDGATIDSRTLRPGQLFVPVVADRDGHDFVATAVSAGAPAYLTSRGRVGSVGAVAIHVEDTVTALAALGRAARDRLPERVVGVTGSVGKTSVKDLTAAALRSTLVVAAAERSFNNELGVPLTLVNAPDGADGAVIEMGARGLGHVALLCSIARPTVGIVTRVAPAHLELFGSIDAVAQGKGELVESLPSHGTAVLNAEDPRVLAMAARTSASVVTYGTGGDVRARDVLLDGLARASFVADGPFGSVPVRLPIAGAHMVGNALAALAAAVAVGVDARAAALGMEAAPMSPWRMEVRRAPAGFVVLNDAYNASPVAMRAAFEALDALAPAGRRVALVGLMAELGTDGIDAHRELAREARARGIELIAVGTDAYGPEAAATVDGHDAALDAVVARRLGTGDAVLVKASRVVGLERVAARLAPETADV